MTRIAWTDLVSSAREIAEDLDRKGVVSGKDWVSAGIKARVLLADLADEVERLRAEREQLTSTCEGMLKAWRRKEWVNDWDNWQAVQDCRAAVAMVRGEEPQR